MIQNYFAEPLFKNYTAPKYPLFIALQNCLNSINSKKNLRDPKSDISSFVEKLGPEGERFVLTWLFESLQLPDLKEKPNTTPKLNLLTDSLNEYSTSQNFISYFPEIIYKVCKQQNHGALVQNLCENLKLPTSTLISIILSLYLSDKAELIEKSENQLIIILNDIHRNKKGSELKKKILEQLIFQISRNPELSLKLEEEYNYLIQIAQKSPDKSDTKLYNYFKCDWRFFSNQNHLGEKLGQPFYKKVDYLKQLGPSVSLHPELLKNALSQNGTLSQQDVFECLVMITNEKNKTDVGIQRFVSEFVFSSSKKGSKSEEIKKTLANEFNNKKSNGSWNIDNFITVCNQICPNIKWQNVFNFFDRQKLEIQSQDHFLSIMKAFEKTKKIGQKWKVSENIFFKKWSNPYSQAHFLIHVFSCKDPESLFLTDIQNKRIQKSVRDCNVLQKQIWGYVDLVQLLVQISDYKFPQIRELFQTPIAKYPELLLMTLSQIKPNKGQALLDELFSNLLPQYLHNHSTNIKLLDVIWENNQDLVISCICQIYKSQSKKQNSFNLSRVLDITQSIKDSLIPFTTWNDYQFSIPLAVIAGKRQFLNFEPWVTDRIEKLSNSFVKAMLLYVENYLVKHLKTITHVSHKQNLLEKAQLTVELLNKIFYTIMSKLRRQQISPRNFELLKKLFKQCCEAFPQITDNQIPDQIERETEREVNRIYKQQISIKDAIERMKKLKNSPKQQDQQQFASHITFLCSELSYHHTYPQKQLFITAELFSALINNNLIDNKIYIMFLNVLEEGLKQENQKYTFSLKVIDKIKGKLSQQGWFCEKLIDNQVIMKKNPQVVQQLIKNLNPPKALNSEKDKKLSEAIKLKNAPAHEPIISVSIHQEEENSVEALKKIELNDYEIFVNLDITKKVQMLEKDTKLSKIYLACNTLSVNNIDQKSKDLKKIIEMDPKAIDLLACNIVFKRVSITSQINGIQLIYRLVEKLPMIQKKVIKFSYEILKEWFALKTKSVNDKKLSSFKNIGYWLGKLTIGRGMPVPIHKLNIRKILIDSFSNPVRLSFNVSVILKILEHIHTHPEIFRPTSPWLSRIICTLSEIQQKIKDIKEEQPASIKNQIKAFFKSTNIKIQNYPITQTSFLNSNNNRVFISDLDKFITVDKQFAQKYLNLKIDLRAVITRAVDDSIQEIVEPVIDRAVKIAKVTTIKLISKDFAYEPDPDKFRESSYKLVKEMAGPLAQVTCREPLKASMNRSLKSILGQSITDLNQMDNLIQKAIADNLDFGCTLIKQAVIESAEQVIKKDPYIDEAIKMRYNAQRQGILFKTQIEIPAIVPEQLRPRPGGLSLEQYHVYAQFKKQKNEGGLERSEQRSSTDKILQIIQEKSSTKLIRQTFQQEYVMKEEILNKINQLFSQENIQQNDLQYYFEVCQILKQHIDAKEAWKSFKDLNDLKKKEVHKIVKRLVKDKYFPQTVTQQLEKFNEQQNKITTLFESWLETAHEGIQPYLRNLEQMFNKSENQIKIFFSCSLQYVMQKVSQSYSQLHDCYDTNYIENYTKLIIISYKTIASNNCSLYLQHTIQSILDVFNKLQNVSNEFSYERPFFKLFTNLICDVTRKQYDIDHEKVLTFYCVLAKQLQKINPLACPSFTCAWMEIINNKYFMPTLLQRYQYWDLYYNLLGHLLKFIREYISQDSLAKKQPNNPYQVFYLGVLKLIVVLLHDFPDFLSQFSLNLALLAGPKFIQINSVIISSIPKELKFELPLNVEKREDLVANCKKSGMPKYYKLKFEKSMLNYYLQTQAKETAFKEKISKEDEENLQLIILYAAWTSQNQLSEPQAARRVTAIITHCYQETRIKLINCILNLIRYPNMVTLFYIDLIKDYIFNKQIKDNSIRQLMLSLIITRMNSENPHSWGEIYLAKQIQIQKNELYGLGVSGKILEEL